MQSFFAELDLLFELLGFSCECRLVFSVDDLICPLLIGSHYSQPWERTAGTTGRTWRNLPSLYGLVVRYKVESRGNVRDVAHFLCGHNAAVIVIRSKIIFLVISVYAVCQKTTRYLCLFVLSACTGTGNKDEF